MVKHRTFTAHKYVAWRPETILHKWEEARAQAQEFINEHLSGAEIVAITESAFGNSPYGCAVTVWYRAG